MPPLLAARGWEVLHLSKARWREFFPALKRFHPRAVVSAGPIGFLPAVCRRLGILRVFLVHDWLDDYAENMGHLYGYPVMSRLEKLAVTGADLVTSPSQFRTEKARRWGKKACFIPHGVEEHFERIPPKNLPGAVRVGYVGIANRAKRVDRLVEAARGLACDLYLIGPAETELIRNAPANAHFLGEVPPGEVPGYVKAFDIAALTMDNDSCVKMSEYIRARCPIVALSGRVARALQAGEEALIVDDLREGIARLIADPGLRAALSAALGRRETFTWPEVAEKFQEAVEAEVL